MKKEVSPVMIVVAVVVILTLIGGLYYKFFGTGSAPTKSNVASPYGFPTAEDFKKGPTATGSGVNSITGEPLSPTAKQAEQHPTRPGAH